MQKQENVSKKSSEPSLFHRRSSASPPNGPSLTVQIFPRQEAQFVQKFRYILFTNIGHALTTATQKTVFSLAVMPAFHYLCKVKITNRQTECYQNSY